MHAIKTLNRDCWVIGYGNTLRGDYGVGAYVAGLVGKKEKKIRILALHQLTPGLIEELQHARLIIFVNATMDAMEKGWRWISIKPELRRFYHGTQFYDPSFFLGLFQSVYHKYPETWLVSVQADHFEFGQGPCFESKQRAAGAASEIMDFLINYDSPAMTGNPATRKDKKDHGTTHTDHCSIPYFL